MRCDSFILFVLDSFDYISKIRNGQNKTEHPRIFVENIQCSCSTLFYMKIIICICINTNLSKKKFWIKKPVFLSIYFIVFLASCERYFMVWIIAIIIVVMIITDWGILIIIIIVTTSPFLQNILHSDFFQWKYFTHKIKKRWKSYSEARNLIFPEYRDSSL